MDPVKPNATTMVYFDVLEADKNGITPNKSEFECKDKSGFQIISKRQDRESIFN